jgi:hypothetical protein
MGFMEYALFLDSNKHVMTSARHLRGITRRKPHRKWCYNVLICTFYVYMDACIKIDTIFKLCACLFGQQLTKYPS